MLETGPRPIPETIWRRLTISVAVVLDTWAPLAVALDWTELDLFGCNPRAPLQRLDQAGLCWFVDDGTEALELNDNIARFRAPHGAVQSFSRKAINEPEGVSVWLLVN